MGLPMDQGLSEIHVPSGPTSGRYSKPKLDGLSLQELMRHKDNLEAELQALGAVLDSHGVNMQSSLTTFDGFPRSDIDVAQVRTTRARIIHLRNDWKDVMDRIEKGLHEHFANTKADNIGATSSAPDMSTTSPSRTDGAAGSVSADTESPFARVNSVEPGSPANEAGLKAGDLITRFGSADWTNHDRLKKVGEIVQQNLGRPVSVKAVRGGSKLELRLTPRQDWGGRGSLGCHILPV